MLSLRQSAWKAAANATWRRSASSAAAAAMQKYPFLAELGIEEENPGVFNGTWGGSGELVKSRTPITGEELPAVRTGTAAEYGETVEKMNAVQREWRSLPAPARGEIVRQIGDELRANIVPLGQLLALEVGKILPEGKGEVQEYVDICDYATGLSRMLNGKVIPSERKDHYMLETWNPVGNIGVISAFNFPVAVYGWNRSLSRPLSLSLCLSIYIYISHPPPPPLLLGHLFLASLSRLSLSLSLSLRMPI